MIIRLESGGRQGPPCDVGSDPDDPAVAIFAELVRRYDAGEVGACVEPRNRLAALGWRVEPRCRPGRRRKAVRP